MWLVTIATLASVAWLIVAVVLTQRQKLNLNTRVDRIEKALEKTEESLQELEETTDRFSDSIQKSLGVVQQNLDSGDDCDDGPMQAATELENMWACIQRYRLLRSADAIEGSWTAKAELGDLIVRELPHKISRDKLAKIFLALSRKLSLAKPKKDEIEEEEQLSFPFDVPDAGPDVVDLKVVDLKLGIFGAALPRKRALRGYKDFDFSRSEFGFELRSAPSAPWDASVPRGHNRSLPQKSLVH